MSNQTVVNALRELVSAPDYTIHASNKTAITNVGRKKLCIIQRILNLFQEELYDDQCWLCKKNLTPNNYVLLQHNYKNYLAHRVLWSAYYYYPLSLLPDNIIIRHKCDNSNCLNPLHLQLGDTKDNIADKVNRSRKHIRIHRKLDDESVKAILQRRNAGEKLRVLACDFGVAESTISMLVNGLRQTYLTDN